MSVNKGISMFTKLDNSFENYLKTIESCSGEIQDIFPAKNSEWIYEKPLSLKECMDYVQEEPVKAKLFIGLTSGWGFYLDVHNRDGKPAIVELEDFGSDRNSYATLFGRYFEAAEKLGNTVCYMNSENEYDAQFRYLGFDKDKKEIGNRITNGYGENIGDKKAIDAYAKNNLGLSVVGNIVRVPEIYMEVAFKDFDTPMNGYVEKLDNSKETFKLGYNYAIASFDKEKNEYRKFAEVSIPLDITVSKDFEKNLTDLVKTDDFQNKLKESAKNLDNYHKNWQTNSFELNDELKTKGYGLQQDLQNQCNFVFFKDLETQKQQGMDKNKDSNDKELNTKELSDRQLKLVFAIESWAKKNNIRNKRGYILSLNRKNVNQQAALNALLKQAKANGFGSKSNDYDKSK